MTFNEAIGQEILDYVDRQGVKKCAIAKYLDEHGTVRYDSAKISITLHGKREMTLREYKNICDFLRVDYSKFLSRIAEVEE